MGLLTQIFKGVGGAAEAAAPGVTELGKYKGQKWLLETKMGWEDLKAKKLAEATLQASQVEARRKGTEFVLKEVGDQITTIESTLGGQTGLNMTHEMRTVQEDRLKRLQDIRDQLSRAHLTDVGWPDDYIIDVLFPGQRKKKDGDDDDDGTDLGEKVKDAKQEGGDDWNILGEDFDLVDWWSKNFLKGTPGKVHFIGEAIENIAWKDDLLLNAIKKYGPEVGKQFMPNEDSEIRQAIERVLSGEEAIINAKSEEDIKNIIGDPVLLKTIVGNIIDLLSDPLDRMGDEQATQEEVDRLGTDPDSLRARGIVPVGDEAASGFPDVSTGDDVGWRDATVERILGTGEGLLAQADTAAVEQPYQDYAPTTTSYPAGSLTEATTEAVQSFAPPPMEEGEDVNQAMVRALATEGTTEALQSADISDIKSFVSEIDSSIKEGSTEALEEMIGKDLRIMYQRSASKVSPEEYLLYLMSELRAAGIADHVPPGWVFKISTAASGTLKMGEGWFEENVLSD